LVIVDQTCDVVSIDGSVVLVAPVIRLPEPRASNARSGREPRYAALPGLGSDAFADLDVIFPIDKASLLGVTLTRGVVGDDQIRKFGQAVGRKFSRFAFPDAVVYWFRPLQSVAQSKALKETKPEGQVFSRVEELRVESGNTWSGPEYDLKLSIIVRPGELPVFADDELPDEPNDLRVNLRPNGLLRKSADIAGMLVKEKDPVCRYFMWLAIAEAWANICKPADSDLARLGGDEERKAVLSAVMGGQVAFEVVSTDDYRLSQYYKSERLDLAHLSSPVPR
jgi:hypothetical protein